MATTERLKDFPTKVAPTPSDIIYLGDAADSYNEVQSTVAQIIAAFPGLASIGGLTTVANQMLITTAANTWAVITATADQVLISSAASVPGFSSTLPATVQGNITKVGTQSQALNMNSHLINNVTDPASAQDAATKNYVDNNVNAGATPVQLASTGALTVTYSNGVAGVGATLTNAGALAAFSLDSVSPTIGQRVLIKNQSSTFQNGIYTVTTVGSGAIAWVLTRATDFDTAVDINGEGVIPVTAGTVNTNTSWVLNVTVTTIGTDPITFAQWGYNILPLSKGGTGAALTLPVITKIATQAFFTASPSYTKTAGCVYAIIEVLGDGGAGASSLGNASGCAAGGGGGAGGYARKTFTSAQIGTGSTSMAIGQGGTPAAAGNNNGGNGTGTTITLQGTGTITISAGGGSGGSAGNTATTNSPGGQGGNGGAGVNGDFIAVGGAGFTGIRFGVDTKALTGQGGDSAFGAGGRGFPDGTAGINGLSGNNFGGGGSGSSSTTASMQGGAGAAGFIVITEFISI